MTKVFVTGAFDCLHEGHVTMFREAAQHGAVYVAVGSDASVRDYKRLPIVPEQSKVPCVLS